MGDASFDPFAANGGGEGDLNLPDDKNKDNKNKKEKKDNKIKKVGWHNPNPLERIENP